MKKIKDILEESYLKSNFAPLYHYTDVWCLEKILNDNILKIGWYDNIFKDIKIKFISLTRNKDLDFSHYRKINIRLCLDTNKLKKFYKIIPYDFFIHQNKTKFGKISSQIRKNEKTPYESEEIILSDIQNINEYIISIDFFDLKDFYEMEYKLKSFKNINPTIDIFLYKELKNIKLL